MPTRTLTAIAAMLLTGCQPPATYGSFQGEVVAKWNGDGRTMTLLEDFAYVDPAAKRWDAPNGSEVNGASIPQVFWSIVGGPFEGAYRNASVVHDVACRQRTDPSSAVHRMFYNACRCGGVSEPKARVMYWAVSKYGPHFEPGDHYAACAQQAAPSKETAQKALAFFSEHDVAVDEIPNLTVETVVQ